MLQSQNPYSLDRIDALTTMLAGMDARARQAYAAQHKNDPAVVATALNVNNIVNAAERAKAMQAGGPKPTVVDQDIAAMTPQQLPENQGIAQIPAPNMQHMADGGIAGFDESTNAPITTKRLDGMGNTNGMFNYAQDGGGVMRMAGGGMPGYKTGGLTDKQEFAAQYKDIAEKVGKELGVDPGILISQWGMETGWGKKQIGQFNLGNIKDVTGKGPKAYDKMEKSRDSYKTYDSPDAFAADYASLIKRNFPKAVGAGSDIGAFSAGLQAGEKGAYATDPNYRKSLANTYKSVTDLLPIGTAQAETVPTTAPDYKGQKAQDTDQSSGSGITSLAGLSGAAMGAADKMRQLYNTHTPLTRTGSMLRNLRPTSQLGIAAEGAGTAAAVPGIVGLGGGVLTAGVTNALSNATPEQLSQMEGFGADPSGTSFGAAILNPENRKPENTPKMSYADQMTNVAKTIVGHPDIDKMREANNKATAEKARAEKPSVKADSSVYDREDMEQGAATYEPPKPAEAIALGKAVTPPEEKQGLSNDDYLSLGLHLLASKSPNALTAAGEAGIGMLADKRASEKAKLDKELGQAHKEYYTSSAAKTKAEADYLTSGAKGIGAVQKAADTDYDNWLKAMEANPMLKMQITPELAAQKRQEFLDKAYKMYKIQAPEGTSLASNAPVSSGGFRFVS